MNWAVLGSSALMLLVMYVPFLQKIFNTVPLGWTEWRLIIPLFLIPSIVAELVKYITQAIDKRKKENK
jgi:Ca2+-transporting ATPase